MDNGDNDGGSSPPRNRRRTRLLSVRHTALPAPPPEISVHDVDSAGNVSSNETAYDNPDDFGDYRGSFRATYPPPDPNEYNGKNSIYYTRKYSSIVQK